MGGGTYGVAFLASDFDNGGEGGTALFSGGEVVEDVAHRTREYAFDLLDLTMITISAWSNCVEVKET